MQNARFSICATVTAVGLAGCATYSEKIAPAYVSPVIYENLSCRQIAEEATRISARAAHVAGLQDNQANKDNVLTAVTIVVFWPAAFFVGGDKQNAAELAQLKGSMDAIEQVSIRKNCGIQFKTATVPPPG